MLDPNGSATTPDSPSLRNDAGMQHGLGAEPGREYGRGDDVERKRAPGYRVIPGVLHQRAGPKADADGNDPVGDDEPEQHGLDASSLAGRGPIISRAPASAKRAAITALGLSARRARLRAAARA